MSNLTVKRWWTFALPTTFRGWLIVTAVFVAVGVAAVMIVPPPHAVFRPECPTDSVLVRDSSTHAFVTYHELSLPGQTTLVPEYHDCQQLLGNNPTGEMGYGPLVGIFARNLLNENIQRMYAAATSGTPAIAVAQLLNFSNEEGYSPLGIKAGFNCLYMWVTIAGSDTTRHAFMTSVDQAEAACVPDLAVNPLPSGATMLNVYSRRPDMKYTTDDYPPVARWDWDATNQRQYIVIGCREVWCDISADTNLAASPAYDNLSQAATLADRRVLRIKGWYDEQLLDVNGSPGSYPLVPSGVTGTLIPAKNLGDLTVAAFDSVWTHVASAVLSNTLSIYQTKLNLEKGAVPDQMNQIDLCKGTTKQCGVTVSAPGTTTNGIPISNTCNNSSDEWWARITSVSGNVVYRCVIRRKHYDVTGAPIPIPGMVRWRWVITDATIWSRCPDGCCEITGGH
jgi:hypothetical protein